MFEMKKSEENVHRYLSPLHRWYRSFCSSSWLILVSSIEIRDWQVKLFLISLKLKKLFKCV